jgi:hypothetical protein
VGEYWTAGREKKGVSTAGREKGGSTAALLGGRGLRCWVRERWTTVALLGWTLAAALLGEGLCCLLGEGFYAAGWDRGAR